MKASSKDFADVLWKNPILRMQMRRRLRAKPVIIWALLTFIPCLFIYASSFFAGQRTFSMTTSMPWRWPSSMAPLTSTPAL